ncbi:unnamed protein product [Caenorhabditis brenneri]
MSHIKTETVTQQPGFNDFPPGGTIPPSQLPVSSENESNSALREAPKHCCGCCRFCLNVCSAISICSL